MNSESTHSIIPDGEYPCVWMDAGVVGFKLCDRELRCEDCPFDKLARNQQEEETVPAPSGGENPGPIPNPQPQTVKDIFDRALARRIKTLTTHRPPADCRIHRNHFWARTQGNRLIRLGVDHVVAGLLRPILGVVVPRIPAAMAVHDPVCWFVLCQGTVTLPAPIAGTVKAFNPALSLRPSVIESDPYGDGWIMEMAPQCMGKYLGEFAGAPVQAQLIRRQILTLQRAFGQAFRKRHAAVGATMLDGGTEVSDVETILGSQLYFEVVSSLFRLPLGV